MTALYRSEFDPMLRSMTTVPLTEAKARLNELVDEAMTTHERVTITRHGRPAVVLVSVDDLESLEETVYWQAQPGIGEDVAAARDEAARGEAHDEASVRRRYGVGTPR